MYSSLSWILFAFLWHNSPSQPQIAEERSAGNKVHVADSLYKTDEYESTLKLYREASQIYYHIKKWDLYAETCIKISNVLSKQQKYKQVESTLKALSAEVLRKMGNTAILGQVYHKLGVLYYKLDDYDNSIVFYNKAIKVRQSVLDKNHLDIANTYYNLGISYRLKGHLRNSLDELKKSLAIREKHTDYLLISKSCIELGKIYEEIGDFKSAIEYYTQALQLFKKVSPSPDADIALCYNNIGIAFYEKKDYPRALENLSVSLKIFLNLYNEQDFNVSNCYNNMGNVYDEQGQYLKALNYYQKALVINRKVKGETSVEAADNYNNIGITFRKLNKYKEATQNLTSSLFISNKIHTYKNTQTARVYDNLGDVSLQQKNYIQALHYYQSAIINTVLNFNNANILSNPNLENAKIIGPKTNLLTLLASKAKCLKSLYQQTNSIQNLILSFEIYKLADQLIDVIRQDYESEDSKLFLSSEAVPFYERAIETTFLLYKLKGDTKYLEKAFHFAERNKAIIVLESLKDFKAKDFANVPATLLAEETNLKVDLAYNEKKLMEEELQGKNDSLITALRTKLLKLKRRYYTLIKEMEEQYPDYYRLKYNHQITSISHIKEDLLDTATALVEYFIGDSSIYIFKITKTKADLVKLDKDFPLEQWVESFLLSMNNRRAADQQPERYIKNSFSLYEKLLTPLLSKAPLPHRLIVIPDGILGYVSFDALLTSPCKPDLSFKEFPFLLKEHVISYGYSATVLIQSQRKPTSDREMKTFLGVAPVFNKSKKFAFLQHSEKEVNDIRQKLGGDLLVASDATKKAFKSTAQEYSILHLSSHSYALDSLPQYSWISFADDKLSDENNYKLYLSELYAMRLNAKMVVLSACETGDGRLSKGEGIMSMARGFAYAGCESIITTLWPVNHSATTQIMTDFYTHLAEGSPKDLALHQAKLDYLQSEAVDNIGAHPFFWAAYIPIGNREKINLKQSNSLLMIMIVGGIILLAIIFWKYKWSH